MSKGGSEAPTAANPVLPAAPAAPATPGLAPMQSVTPAQGYTPFPTAGFAPAPMAAGSNIYDQSAQNMAQATQNIGFGTGLMASGAAPIYSGMGAYQNPFEQQVMTAFQNDLGRQTAMQQSANQARAALSGAFGGSRHGLVEAQTNEAAQRNLGQFSAGLRSQGFNTAAQLANQDIQNRMAAGTGMFAGAGLSSGIAGQQFGMGQDVADQQWRQGALTQGMNQMLLDDARNMFNQFVNQPQNLLDLRQGAAAMSPLNQAGTTTTTGMTTGAGQTVGSYTPGLFDYLSLAGQAYGNYKR